YIIDICVVHINDQAWSAWICLTLNFSFNRWDCGMFMLKFIDFHSRGIGLCFTQEHMDYFRKRTAKEILRLRAD
ncbi:Os03g0410100, partial [Oryza sativa Japonica Group]